MFSWHLERLVPCCNFLCSVGKLSTRKLMSAISRSPFISRKKSEMASKPSSPRTKRNSNPHSLKDPVSKPNSSVNNTNSNGRAVRRTISVSVLPSRPSTIQKKTETTYSSTFTTSRVPDSSARASVTDLTGETQYYQPSSLSSARQSRQRQKTVKVTLSPRDVTKNLEQLKLSPPRTLPPTPKSTPSSSINSLPTEVCAGSRHSPSQSKSNSPLPHQPSQSLNFSQVSSQQEKGLTSKQNQSMNFASKNQTSSAQPQAFFMDLPKYSKQKILTDKQSQSMDMSYSSKSGSILTKSQSHPSTFHGIWTIQPEILVDVTPPFYGGNYPLATSRHTSSSEPTLQTSSGSLTSYEHPRLSWSSGYKSNTPSPSPSPSRSPSPSSIMKFESKGSASSFKSLSSTSSNVTAVTKSTVSPVHAPMTQSLPSQFDKNDIPVVKVGISGVVDPVRNGLVGLRNVGNTCYMNSMLHCLSNTKKLTTYFLSGEAGKEKQSGKGGLVEVFTDLLRQMWEAKKGTGQVIVPTHLKQRISQLSPTFYGHQQHDAQEFLQSLLFLLHDELNKPKKRAMSPSPRNASDNELAESSWKRSLCYDNSHISNLFMGQLKSTLTCLKCKKSSVTFDPFWDISLPLPPNNQPFSTLRRFSNNNSSDVTVELKDCFELFAAEEKLDGDNRPVCAHCNVLQTCAKKLSIQKFPEILVLHIKRFSCGRVRTKLETQVNYPKTLSILPEVAADKESAKSIQYELYGVVNHMGTLFSGHYTAHCKHPKLDKWYQFNDSYFDVIPSPITPSKSAYILFYEKKTNSS